MLEQLLPYYERELGYLRELSGEFAKRYPKIAGRLHLEGDVCEDPHVERLMEGFSFLTARIHRKLDDEFPEITEAFLEVLYPHYLRPVPSMTIAQFELDEANPGIATCYDIPRNKVLQTPPVQGVACQFRTAYPVALWPIKLAQAKIEVADSSEYLRRNSRVAAVLTMTFSTLGNLTFGALKPDNLRLFLDGEPGLMHLLYQLLFTQVDHIQISDGSNDPAKSLTLQADAIKPVGFDTDEGLLNYDARSFLGYRLLTEYFAFPEKFMFVDFAGLTKAPLAQFGSTLQIRVYLRRFPDDERHARLMQTLEAGHLKLGCTPAVNLFKQAAEPIRITHQKNAYRVVADSRRQHGLEVYSIDSVRKVEKIGTREIIEEVRPFYSIQHSSRDAKNLSYWYAKRSSSTREDDPGTEVELSLADLSQRGATPETEVLSLELTCTNRDLPRQLPFGGNNAQFVVESGSAIECVRYLRKPTPSLGVPVKRSLQWRLISHLSLNYLSLASQGKDALQELLTLYNYTASSAISKQIEGIVAVDSKPGVSRIRGTHFAGFVRGTDVTITFDEEQYVGSGLYLFGSVLERFLGLYSAPNSFVRLRAQTTENNESDFAIWPPRAGESVLI